MASAPKTQTSNQPQGEAKPSREELIAQARKLLREGESLFDIMEFPLLRLNPVTSRCLSLKEYGIESDLLNGEGERSERARRVIYVNGDPEQGYAHSVQRAWPAIRKECYADPNKVAQAIVQWYKAAPLFDKASVYVGVSAFGRKNYNTDGSPMGEPGAGAGDLLYNALERGIDLAHQGKAYTDEVLPSARRAAEREGFQPVSKAKAKRNGREEDEI